MSSIASGNFSASRSLRVRSIPLMKGRTPVPAIPGKGTSLQTQIVKLRLRSRLECISSR